MSIRLKRVYEAPEESDGCRVLVDHLWPRGLSKDRARVDLWLKEVAPSNGLRTWFNHDPEKWEEFRRRYFLELDGKPEAVDQLTQRVSAGTVTFLFAAKEERFNNAVALTEYVEKKLGGRV